jgi:hypothetical protein
VCGGARSRRTVRAIAACRSGIVAAAEIEPVPLLELPVYEFGPNTYRYRVRNGFHRFYASVVVGSSTSQRSSSKRGTPASWNSPAGQDRRVCGSEIPAQSARDAALINCTLTASRG